MNPDSLLKRKPARWSRVASVGGKLLGVGSLATLLKRHFTGLDDTRRSLEISRERMALAVAGSDAGIWDWDIAGDRIVASQRAFEIFGLPSGPESRTRDEWLAALRIHPADAAAQHAAIRAHLAGETAACFSEFRVHHGDGEYRWVRVRGQCVRDAAGTALRMAGSVADIDAQRRAEDALRVSEERFALAVAGSDDGLWDWDYRSGIAFESRRARELQGLPLQPEAQPLGELIASLRMHPEDVPRRGEAFRAHLASETPHYECEYRVHHAGGQ